MNENKSPKVTALLPHASDCRRGMLVKVSTHPSGMEIWECRNDCGAASSVRR